MKKSELKKLIRETIKEQTSFIGGTFPPDPRHKKYKEISILMSSLEGISPTDPNTRNLWRRLKGAFHHMFTGCTSQCDHGSGEGS